MMAQDRAESIREQINYVKFINQCRPDIITFIQQLKKRDMKVSRQKMSILFNQTCFNEEMQTKYTHTHTHTHT